MRKIDRTIRLVAIFSLSLSCAGSANAQLRISEIMYDTASDETPWEWFEVSNIGAVDIDLDGYVLDDFHITTNAKSGATIINAASGGNSKNTVVPGGGVAVIYNGAALDYDETRFRDAWGISSTVPLIGNNGALSLNNGAGDWFGLWETFDAYSSDLANTDDDEGLEVTGFNNAVVSINYGSEGFPIAKNASIEWNGDGDYQDGLSWNENTADTKNIRTSVQTLLPTSPLNSVEDTGSPGTVSATGQTNSLVFSELMYNPKSSEPSEWEWVEIFNGTGTNINFEDTPYFLDDSAGIAIAEANVNSGSIADGGTAVLYRGSIPLENMVAAWGEEVNFIPVSPWGALNSDSDVVALWDSADAYNTDSNDTGRTYDEAIVSVPYADGGEEGWPNISEGQSINIVDLEVSPDSPTNWVLSSVEDGVSRNPELVLSSNLIDHAGGDLGTPGSFGRVVDTPPTSLDLDLNADGAVNSSDAPLVCIVVAGEGLDFNTVLENGGFLPGDFDFSGDVSFLDFLTLANGFGERGHYGKGDANCDGSVGFLDFLALANNFGKSAAASATAVPEPKGVTLVGFGVFLLPLARRRRS